MSFVLLASDQSNVTNLFSWGGVVPLLVGTVLPLVVGFVTNAAWPGGLKFAILGLLSGVTGFLGQYLDSLHTSQPFAWQSVALTALLTWAIAELTWLRGWAKTEFGVANAAGPPLSGPTDDTDSLHAPTQPYAVDLPEPSDPVDPPAADEPKQPLNGTA